MPCKEAEVDVNDANEQHLQDVQLAMCFYVLFVKEIATSIIIWKNLNIPEKIIEKCVKNKILPLVLFCQVSRISNQDFFCILFKDYGIK